MARILKSIFSSPPALAVIRWFDSEAAEASIPTGDKKKVDWVRTIPLVFLHLMCMGVIWVGWSWTALIVALLLDVIRMFAITGFYHRYFSHKAFETNRFWQFVFRVMGNASVQRGPLWWAFHHRHHHRYTDQKQDVHFPSRHGFWWEIDITYSLLVFMSWLGIVRDLRPVPEHVRHRNIIITETST